MNDEIYRRPRLHPQAQPLIAVTIKGRTDTVAWTFERPDGGRSFGTTLGHPWSNWQDKTFRRMVLNGILWTTEGKPRAGSGGR
jgi:type 1 glutamine amidotransferase